MPDKKIILQQKKVTRSVKSDLHFDNILFVPAETWKEFGAWKMPITDRQLQTQQPSMKNYLSDRSSKEAKYSQGKVFVVVKEMKFLVRHRTKTNKKIDMFWALRFQQDCESDWNSVESSLDNYPRVKKEIKKKIFWRRSTAGNESFHRNGTWNFLDISIFCKMVFIFFLS